MADRCEKEERRGEPELSGSSNQDAVAGADNNNAAVMDDNDRSSSAVSGSGTSMSKLHKDESMRDNVSNNQVDNDQVKSDDLEAVRNSDDTNTPANTGKEKVDKIQEFHVHETNFSKGQLILKLKTNKSSLSSSSSKMSAGLQELDVSKKDTQLVKDANQDLSKDGNKKVRKITFQVITNEARI